MHVCLQNGEGGISESVCLQEGQVIGAQEQLCEAGHIDWGPHSLGHVLKTVRWQLPARKCQIVILVKAEKSQTKTNGGQLRVL